MILAATIAGFVVLFGAIVCVWLVLLAVGISTNLWDMTQAVSTVVAAAAVFGAGFVAYRELGELAHSRHVQIADSLFAELNSAANIEARRWIFKHLPPDPEDGIPSLTPEDHDTIKRVLNSMDRVAFLTQSGWIPERLIMPWMNPMIVKAWTRLEPYVRYEGERRHEPDYYEHARALAERCLAWRAKNLPAAEITWIDDAL
jgi:hypothetical protein